MEKPITFKKLKSNNLRDKQVEVTSPQLSRSMKRKMKLPIKLLLFSFGTILAHGEVTISGPLAEIRKQILDNDKPPIVKLSGEYIEKEMPLEYTLEGFTYSRGKKYNEVVADSLRKQNLVKQKVGDLNGVTFLEGNAISLPQGDLASSELKELEYQVGFRLVSQSLKDLESAMSRMIDIEGIIVSSVKSKFVITPEFERQGISKAIDNLESTKKFYEERFGISLKFVSFYRPYLQSYNDSSSEEIQLLSPFSVSSRRKFDERNTRTEIIKGFAESEYKFEVMADYTVGTKEN